GLGATIIGDDLYSFACQEATSGRPCLLARVPLAEVLDRAAWRFHTGSSGPGRPADWSSELAEARPLFSGAPIMSVAWNELLGSYMAVYAPSLANRVVMRTA